mmetsp:Transcript_41524/g.50331  ORF Transcript_41524/g.50331 Transcript_41524/m.50331 type:complete len:117 (+) Transcript_41524:92-442(+)
MSADAETTNRACNSTPCIFLKNTHRSSDPEAFCCRKTTHMIGITSRSIEKHYPPHSSTVWSEASVLVQADLAQHREPCNLAQAPVCIRLPGRPHPKQLIAEEEIANTKLDGNCSDR